MLPSVLKLWLLNRIIEKAGAPLKDKKIMRLRGIEPPHMAPEAIALSTELQTHANIILYFSVRCKHIFAIYTFFIMNLGSSGFGASRKRLLFKHVFARIKQDLFSREVQRSWQIGKDQQEREVKAGSG